MNAPRFAPPKAPRDTGWQKALRSALAVTMLVVSGCGKSAPAEPSEISTKNIPGHDSLPEDTTPKEGPRLVPPEAFIRSYLMLFGNLSPVAAQAAARGADNGALFDTWNDYLSSLGLPDYRVDIPRATQANTLMLATFERLGVALCDRSVERDFGPAAPAVEARIVFAFDLPASALDEAGFRERFDVLHRTFLGYPLALSPTDREARFFQVYNDVVARHAAKGAPRSRFSPPQAGWAAVCYGLVRHPEFHFY